jgi:hypothetical protein
MRRVFSCCGAAVMTSRTTSRGDIGVIEDSGLPGIGAMATITGLRRRNMRRVLASRGSSIVASRA